MFSFPNKSHAESSRNFVKKQFFDPKRAKFDQNSSFGHVRAVGGRSAAVAGARRRSPAVGAGRRRSAPVAGGRRRSAAVGAGRRRSAPVGGGRRRSAAVGAGRRRSAAVGAGRRRSAGGRAGARAGSGGQNELPRASPTKMKQNHLEISSKYHFWNRNVRNWSKSLTESLRKVHVIYGKFK